MAADIIALPVECGGVVDAEKDLQQGVVTDRSRGEQDLYHFGMARAATANLIVYRLQTPETAATECGQFSMVGHDWFPVC